MLQVKTTKNTASLKKYNMIIIIAIILIALIGVLGFSWYFQQTALKDREVLKDLTEKGYVVDGGKSMSCSVDSIITVHPEFAHLPTTPPSYIPRNCRLCDECSGNEGEGVFKNLFNGKCLYYVSCNLGESR
jgi:hypothetical protein